ncbi:MAG: sodium:solute symporter [Flavobacteriales bacterium]|nr:sodium:solute symporter [Flavobacteriales bacterium]
MSAWTNLAILLGYFGLLIVVSWLVGRKSDSTSFYTGNRKSPWFLVAFGMIGASISGVTFISIPGWVANTHFGYMQTVLGYMVGYMVIALVLLPLYYKMNLTSIYTYLEKRYGFWGYKTGAAYFIVSRIIGSAFRLYLAAEVLYLAIFEPLHIPYWLAVAITIALVFTYTSKSGIKSVVYTDTLQTFFLISAVVLTIIFISNQLGYSFSGLIESIKTDPNSQIFHWDAKSSNNFFKQFIGGAFIALAMTGLDQDMMQKNLSINNIKSAQKNIYVQMFMFIVVNIVFLTLGLLLYQYAAHIKLEALAKTDDLFPTIALKNATPFISTAFIIGLVAAAYSSADSALTALTTSFCVDFLGFERNKPTNLKVRQKVHIGFAVVLFLVIIGFSYWNNDAVIKQLFTIAGYTYGPLVGLFFFGILTNKKVDDAGILPITLLSIAYTAAYSYVMPKWFDGFKPGFELILVNGLITFVLLALISKEQKKNEIRR